MKNSNKITREKKYEQIRESMRVISNTKDSALKQLISTGKRMGKYRYFMLCGLFVFLFLYHFTFHLCIQLRLRERTSRAFACFMVAVLALTSISLTAMAFGNDAQNHIYGKVVAIEALSDEVTNQTIVQGESFEEIIFPDTLTATVVIGESTTEPTDLPTEELKEELPEKLQEIEENTGDLLEELGDIEEVEEPEQTEESQETEEPEQTEKSQETEEPEQAEESQETEEPEQTEESQGAEEPEQTEESQGAEEPEQTEEPHEEVSEESQADQRANSDEETASVADIEKSRITMPSLVEKALDVLFPPMTAYAAEEEGAADYIYREEMIQIPIKWVLDKDRSSAERFSSEEAGQVFVYCAELPDDYELADDIGLPEITVSIEATTEFEQNVVVDDISISVYAPEGVFPLGASLRVSKITNTEVVSEIEQMVTEHKDEQTPQNIATKVEESFSFDIRIVDADGQEIEPDTSKGQVEVVFQNVGVATTTQLDDLEMSVYYVTDEIDEIEELETNLDADADSISINTNHFSIYTVVITTEVQKNTVLKYYQASTRQDSYFTIYTNEELHAYKELLNRYFHSRDLSDDARVATILVNGDDANPIDGITGVGQEKDFSLSDLNFSAKLMDDILVEAIEVDGSSKSWTPIEILPQNYHIMGNGKTISFKGLSGRPSLTQFIKQLEGIVDNIILVNGNDWENRLEIGLQSETEYYASVTVRVDGVKSDIGKAITGAEALAISCDGENFITLERHDDIAVYRTPIENLEIGEEYHVYYAYENQNGTISEITIKNDTPVEELTQGIDVVLNYVSVTYELEGANTYRRNSDGTLSEDVMAAVRVYVKEDGSYEAQEDYEAVIKAAEGFSIPSLWKHVKVSVADKELDYEQGDYSYVNGTSDYSNADEGTISIAKEKITGPIVVKVEADKIEDFGKVEVVLHTRGCGNVTDQMWDNPKASTYTQVIYAKGMKTISLPTPEQMNTLNGTEAIRFEGWYTDMSCTGSSESSYTYNESDITNPVNKSGEKNFYAKWVLNEATSHNESIGYEYQSSGNVDVFGWENDKKYEVTYRYGGFNHDYVLEQLDDSHTSGTKAGTAISLYPTGGTNGDIFKRIGATNIWVALICSLQGQYVDLTYVFENRGTEKYPSLYFGEAADIAIHSNDKATISIPESKKFFNMIDGNYIFRLYFDDSDFGVDKMHSYWCGEYSVGSYMKHKYHQVDADSLGSLGVFDSAAAFSWHITDIAPEDYIMKTTKLGIGDASSMKNVTATLSSGSFGAFPDGTQQMNLISNEPKVEVSSDGQTVTAIHSAGNQTSQIPTRTSYVFDGWYLDEAAKERPAAGKTFTQDVKLYAKWVPNPDKSVTNNCSVQKVNGSSNLLVPETLGHIVLYNNTVGAKVPRIVQGETVENAVGNASDFVGVLAMEGEDSRYLLPDDIKVELTDDSGNVIAQLTKGTGYEYYVWNNRKKATIEIHKQFIKGNVVITAIGYELPPVTATSISVNPSSEATDYAISYGEKATFVANAHTSQNHVATYQWYIAPYDEITLDNVKYWTYQNQNGTALSNGVGTYNFGSGPIEITVSGANKATLRLSDLPVNYYGNEMDTYNNQLHLGGYHIYCVVTSVRNITGQSAVAVSKVVEVQVERNTYGAPTGLEGSATTYYGGQDGEVFIEQQPNRSTLAYRREGATAWTNVSTAQIEAGKIEGLAAGSYEFKYLQDANHNGSDITRVTVEQGRYLLITYRALGCDNETLRMQYQHVPYQTVLSDSTTGYGDAEGTPVKPERTGYSFLKWNYPSDGVTSDTIVDAVYTNGCYKIDLNGNGASNEGTTAIYECYGDGFYLERDASHKLDGNNKIVVPKRDGYLFCGYYTAENGGTQLIDVDGCISSNMSATRFLSDAELFARWEAEPVEVNSPEGVELTIEPEDPTEEIIDEKYEYETDYSITVTNDTGKPQNVIYIFSNGTLMNTITGVIFDDKNQYTLVLKPAQVGGGSITITLGYVAPTITEDGVEEPKTEAEILTEANQEAAKVQYHITYMDVDGTRTGSVFTGSFVTAAQEKGIFGVTTVLPKAMKSGYTFAGWHTNVRGTGTAITEINEAQAEDITVYAKWIANTNQITYVTNGGSFVDGFIPPSQFQYAEVNVDLPTTEQITRENYRFMGWYENADGIGEAITKTDTLLNHDLTIFAVWEKLPLYTINLTPDGENGTIFTYEAVENYESPQAYEGGQYCFRVNAAAAYAVKSVKANGKVLPFEGNLYTIEDIRDNMTVIVMVEELVSTSEPAEAVATILLSDGTTGYFTSLEDAVQYAVKHGSNSVIQLQEDFDTISLEIPSGNAFTIDLNGRSIGNDSVINVGEGAELSLVDDADPTASSYNLTVENRGTVNNAIEIADMLNYGTVNNEGIVRNITQGQSEAENGISKFENNGTVGNMTLESGYYKQGEGAQGGSGELPYGLVGYNTIMNGNEYYANFQDAVTIANQSEEDVEIRLLSNVDNMNKSIHMENANGREITLDLNGCSILNGTLAIAGDVQLENTAAADGKVSAISAQIDNTGNTKVQGGINVSGAVDNDGRLEICGDHTIMKEDGTQTTLSGAVISGSINNRENAVVNNDGRVTGVVSNYGQVVNNGSMNNVIQYAGNFENNGEVRNQFVLAGGGYQASEAATPQIPISQGTDNGTPVVMSNTVPVVYYGSLEDAIKALNNMKKEDAPAEGVKLTLLEDVADFAEKPLVIDSDVPITIDTNGNNLGDADGSDAIVISDGSSVAITNTATEPEEGGSVNVTIENQAGAALLIDESVTVKGEVTNTGDLINKGVIENLKQAGGSFVNEEGGIVSSLTQSGGTTENNGTITNADISGGGITGSQVEENESIDKVAQIRTKDAENNEIIIYFGDLNAALDYAAGENTDTPLVVELLQDISGETIVLDDTKTPVILDVNGHSIDSTSSVQIGEDADLQIQNSHREEAGSRIEAPITNSGSLTLDETADVSQISNSGSVTNNGSVDSVEQTSGSFFNGIDGKITEVNLQAGSYTGAQPHTPIGNAEAEIGDTLYGKLSDAVDAANASDKNETITILNDVVLEEAETLYLDNENGKELTIDINGNSISGGTIQIGDGNNDSMSGVMITDSSAGDGSSEGNISSTVAVSENSKLTIDEDTTIDGKVTNNGIMENNGTLREVNQSSGEFTNNGTVETLEQEGGSISNAGTVESLTVKGGEFTGEAPETADYEGAKVSVSDGTTTKYYPTLEAAMEAMEGNETVTLLDDISGETVNISKPGITLDLNGHSISEDTTITVTEEADNISIINSDEEGNKGKIEGEIVNQGELTIGSDIDVQEITNNKQLTNNGGTIAHIENTGDVTNNGTVEEMEFLSGSFTGSEPTDPGFAPAASIGNRYYADLESAIEAANEATEDTTITILQDTTLPENATIANEAGNTVIIDLNDHEVTDTGSEGKGILVAGNGRLEIMDSGESGNGVLNADLTVAENAEVVLAPEACVDGDINNKGNFENKGEILGDVENAPTGRFVNDTTDSYVGGEIDNKGDMTNTGVINGEITNTGSLTNEGNIDSNITNTGNGSFDNKGNVNGQLVNDEDATTQNSGKIFEVKLEDGTFNNTDNAEVSSLIQKGGNVNNAENGNLSVSASGGTLGADIPADDRLEQIKQAFGPTATVTYDEDNDRYQVELETDIQLSSPIIIDEIELEIDLNGHEITGPSGQSAIIVSDNTTIMLTDSSESGEGAVNAGKGTTQKALIVEDGGTIEIGGRIEPTDENGKSWIETSQTDADVIRDYTIRIRKEPVEATATEGRKAEFRVMADSHYDLSYQWYVNTGDGVWKEIGGNEPSFTAFATKAMNGYSYRCVISNDKSNIISKTALLKVLTDTQEQKTESKHESAGKSKSSTESESMETDAAATTPITDAPEGKAPLTPTPTTGAPEGKASAIITSTTEASEEKEASEGKSASEATPIAEAPIEESLESEAPIKARDIQVKVGTGTVTITTDMEAGELANTAGNMLKVCLTEEEIAEIEKGANAEIRITVVRYVDESEVEADILAEMLQAKSMYAENIVGLTQGQFVEISVEKNHNNTGWVKIRELAEQLEIVLTIPENLRAENRSYYMLRNHSGVCEILQDTDENDNTITFQSSKFSTYLIMYTDEMTPMQDIELQDNELQPNEPNEDIEEPLLADTDKTKKNNLLWIIALLILICGIGYYFYHKKNGKE